jgi:hypothetical protein
MRFVKLAVVGLSLLLTGCGLPPAIVAFSYAMDGVSYASSGKSVTDHALSAAIEQDCAMFRAIQGRDICREDVPDVAGTALAAVEEKAPESAVAAQSAHASWRIQTGSSISAAGAKSWSIRATDNLTLINPAQSPVIFNSSDGHPDTARLMNFPAATEVFALVQDDGALEIFVYGAGQTSSGRGLALIATYENYSDNPSALKGVSIGGAFHPIGDLIV